MDASAREALRKGCEERARELRANASDIAACGGDDGAKAAWIAVRGAAMALEELANLLAQRPPLPSLDDIMSGPDLEQMGKAMAGDAAEMEEQCTACGLGIAGLVRCSRDDCPHDRLRKEVKR